MKILVSLFVFIVLLFASFTGSSFAKEKEAATFDCGKSDATEGEYMYFYSPDNFIIKISAPDPKQYVRVFRLVGIFQTCITAEREADIEVVIKGSNISVSKTEDEDNTKIWCMAVFIKGHLSSYISWKEENGARP